MSIIGDCPHDACGKSVWRLLPETPLPKFSHEDCPECGQPVWVYYSRIDPKVYTEVQFASEYDVNHVTRTITPKPSANA